MRRGWGLRAVVKNMFRFEPFIRSWKGVSLFEVKVTEYFLTGPTTALSSAQS